MRERLSLSVFLVYGAQYESYTMIPVIDDFKQRFGLDDFIVVADSGFMIKRNIELLRSGKYQFIIGGRIKKLTANVEEWVLSLLREDNKYHEYILNGNRLIVTHCSKRASKDVHNRTKGVERLRKSYA